MRLRQCWLAQLMRGKTIHREVGFAKRQECFVNSLVSRSLAWSMDPAITGSRTFPIKACDQS